jgi:hypothetical protein
LTKAEMPTYELMRWAVAAAGLVAVTVAALLLLIPKARWEVRTRLQRVLLEADLTTIFDRRFTIEKRVYRHHRLFGAFVLAGALSGLTLLFAIVSRQPAIVSAVAALGPTGARVLAASGAITMLVVLLSGVILFLRPSALKGIEGRANRWFEPLSGMTPSPSIARPITSSPRAMGTLLLLAGVVCLLNL